MASFLYLGRDLSKMGENQKNDDSSSLLKVFGSWGCSWRLCWPILALCWAMLGHLGAILEQLGDKMRPESAKMIQDSAQERQDEARWRKWAPEGGRDPCGEPRANSMPPFKKQHQRKPGAPPGGSTWNLVELRLEAEPGNS